MAAAIAACPGFTRLQGAELGQGSFGVAFLEREDATGEQYALKYIPRAILRVRATSANSARDAELPRATSGNRHARVTDARCRSAATPAQCATRDGH
jgi:hypothetical protein